MAIRLDIPQAREDHFAVVENVRRKGTRRRIHGKQEETVEKGRKPQAQEDDPKSVTCGAPLDQGRGDGRYGANGRRAEEEDYLFEASG
jgi:hypothetical protein